MGRISHGMARSQKTSEYNIWVMMRQRCLNPSNKRFPLYGGRGITICPQWSEFAVFLNDVGPRPSKKHSLDRMDNNGPYSPENCGWRGQKEQCRNKRTNRLVTLNGEAIPLAEACERFGVKYGTAKQRLKMGWPHDEAFGLVPHVHRLTGVYPKSKARIASRGFGATRQIIHPTEVDTP